MLRTKVWSVGTNPQFDESFDVYGHGHITVGNDVVLNDLMCNVVAGDIFIGDYVFFGHRCVLLVGSHDYTKYNLARQVTATGKNITIQEGAWIASCSIVLPGVTIGKHSVVAAGSVVSRDVPEYCVVAGNPARIIKRLAHE